MPCYDSGAEHPERFVHSATLSPVAILAGRRSSARLAMRAVTYLLAVSISDALWAGNTNRSAVHAAAPHNATMNIRLFLGGLRPPRPSQGPGPGCAGLRPASAEVWGNPVSPPPSPRTYVHVRRGAPREPPGGRSRDRRRRDGVSPPLRRPASRQGLRPLPDPPPPGAGTRRLPPAGGGWEGG